jgi:5-methylcytosine-specific restriction enzyme subunit McrC
VTEDRRTLSLAEWETREVTGVELHPDDRSLVKELRASPDERIVIDELRDAVKIRSTSWVGVVRLRNWEIRVIPKLAGAQLGVMEMIDVTSGLDALWRGSSVRELDSEGNNLYDLFVLLFVEECERILRSGVLADYVEKENALAVLRGRLLFDRQLKQRYGQLDKLICRYDQHEQDIIENQIIAFALDHCGRRVRHSVTARRVHQVGAIFREICDWKDLDSKPVWGDLTYHRLNEHYRAAHDLAGLVTRGVGVTNLYGRGSTDCFAFLIDMNLLFERFVLQVLNIAMQALNVEVRYQKPESSVVWNVLANRPYRRVIPDCVLTQKVSGAMLAVDAKYKLYDDRKVQSGDIYQAFIYAYAYSNSSVLPQAVLLYPSADVCGSVSNLQIRTVMRAPRAALSVVGIHIPTMLRELKHREGGPAIAELGRTLIGHLVGVRSPVSSALASESLRVMSV